MKSFASLIKLLTCTILLAVSPAVLSQPSTGSIKGTVTDQLGGLVINATVVLKNGKFAGKTASTDAEGNYELRGLPAGKYDLTITAAGFQTVEEANVEVRPGKATSLNAQLTIGELQ